jgi:type 2 lantibiotic biosynthesis protein LanM
MTLKTPVFPYFRAMTLTERMAYFNKSSADLTLVDMNEQLGHRRLARWKSQTPFHDEDAFSARLALDELTEDELVGYLRIEHHELVDDGELLWQKELRTVLATYKPEVEPIRIPDSVVSSRPDARFLEAFQPFLQFTYSQLKSQAAHLLQPYSDVPLDLEILPDIFLANIPPLLTWVCSRTLVLELNVARLEGRLTGSTPEERFADFLHLVQQPNNLMNLLAEYPVLARTFCDLTSQWRATFVEFLEHLIQDWPAIQQVFASNRDMGKLVAVNIGSGDRHRGGRSVIIVTFSSGTQLVYKPRCLAIDRHFQELLSWLNKKGCPWPFRTVSVMDCQTHGWVEFIAPGSCNTREEVRRFYKRQGAYLALLYALEANDFHYENLIAHGEHPVLIDLETLFCPSLVPLEVATDLSHQLLTNSVLKVGLLPKRLWADESREGVDISGLGMQPGQLTPSAVPIFQRLNTDEMHLSGERRPLLNGSHQPVWQDRQINAIEYSDDIVEGFTSMYNLLLESCDELIGREGFLACFAQDPIRCILRPTRTYYLLLLESMHPDFMREALDRDQFFSKLWSGVSQDDNLFRIIPFECTDLWRSDVPIFTSFSDSVDLWTSEGVKIRGFFNQSGIECVERKIQRLSPSDLKQQVWLIQASMATLARVNHATQPNVSYYPAQPERALSYDEERLLGLVRSIGDRLADTVIRQEERVSWLGIKHNIKHSYFSVEPLALDLYNGLPGLAFFLAYLGEATDKSQYTHLAKQVLDTIWPLIDRDDLVMGIGAFEGWAGIIYFLSHLAVLWNDDRLLLKAVEIAGGLHSAISKDDKFDIMSGAAGCIGVLLALNEVLRDRKIVETATRCGEHLLKNSVSVNGNVAWLQQGVATIKQPLTGFSHGVAGIAWALVHLAQVTDEQKFTDVAMKSLVYERSMFSSKAGNWSDLRDFSALGKVNDNKPRFAHAWCHGAPGIGLARLSILKWLDDELIRQEIDAALKSTMANGLGKGHCLCHGDLGNLELFVEANKILDDKWCEYVQQVSMSIVTHKPEHNWVCGNTLGVEEPGLMTGLAGIGYTLLRLVFPTRIPNLLLLEPPIAPSK